MANVTLTDAIFDDDRFDHLGVILGIDGDLARMKMARLWSRQTEEYTPERPTYVVSRGALVGRFGPRGPDALVEAGLAEERGDGFYIKGTEGAIEWLWKKKAAGKKGREAQVKSASARALSGQTPDTPRAAPRVVTGPCDPGSEIRDPGSEEPERESRGPAAPAALSLLPDEPEMAKPKPGAEFAASAVAMVNAATGRNFDPTTKATVKLCAALEKQGRTLDEVRVVVSAKAAEWLGTSLADRVCPATLFAADNFDRYLDEARAGPTRAPPPRPPPPRLQRFPSDPP